MRHLTDDDLTIARQAARRFARRYGYAPDEALSMAYVALVQAAVRFDDDRGIPFEPYARKFLEWRLTDEIRSALSERRRVGRSPRGELPDPAFDSRTYERVEARQTLMTMRAMAVGRAEEEVFDALLRGETQGEMVAQGLFSSKATACRHTTALLERLERRL